MDRNHGKELSSKKPCPMEKLFAYDDVFAFQKIFFLKKKDAPFAWVLCEFLAGVESDAKQCNLVPGGGK